jgi:hypothetical protein
LTTTTATGQRVGAEDLAGHTTGDRDSWLTVVSAPAPAAPWRRRQ